MTPSWFKSLKRWVENLNSEYEDEIMKFMKWCLDSEILIKKENLILLLTLRSSFLNRSVFSGIPLGEIGSRERFIPHPEISSVIGPFLKKAYSSEKGAVLFTYGRDLFIESVLGYSEMPRDEECLLICDAYGRDFGIGRYKRGERIIVNLLDRGLYLRKGY